MIELAGSDGRCLPHQLSGNPWGSDCAITTRQTESLLRWNI